ncbi:hypothetical protein M2140_001817, partial [Clostridiales Family XIII bacterium PM5-7]
TCRKWLSYTLGILQWATIKLLFYDSTFWGTRQCFVKPQYDPFYLENTAIFQGYLTKNRSMAPKKSEILRS